MKKAFFLTGATGLVGSYLLKELLAHGHTVYALARGSASQSARKRIQEVLEFWAADDVPGKVVVVEGDVASKGLGLNAKTRNALFKNINEIFHCAAITDLNRPKNEVSKVNVGGTRNVLGLARQLSVQGRLVKMNHISTAYIYGDYHGVFNEGSLYVGQKFSTNYEESKFQAELVVEEFRKKGLWVDVFRAPIVIGDSKTGRTFQFKHIYQFINLCKLELFDVLPIKGMYASVAPVDLLSQAIYIISQNTQERNKNYHPFPVKPVSIEHAVEVGAKLIGFKKPKVVRLCDFNINNLTPAQKILLRNSILSVNLRVTLDSRATNRELRKFNCPLPEVDARVLIRALKYFLTKNVYTSKYEKI